jgi:hypothetical protein
MSADNAAQNGDLTRLEILRAFKRRFAPNDQSNHSPFEMDRVVRYDTKVLAYDVPQIHQETRESIAQRIRDVREKSQSGAIILVGDPGLGKSHILNYFRSPEKADELSYFFVCNSNHWKANEFEECLLDWLIDALVYPSPSEPHALLEKVQDIAFQALAQILDQPGHHRRFVGKKDGGLLSRVWARIWRPDRGRWNEAYDKRDVSIFRQIDFARFSEYVCDRFLPRKGHPFHRYVLQVLLRYLYPEDREKTLHWLRGKNVHGYFLPRLGAEDYIDKKYKALDAIKVLLSLFSPEVSERLNQDRKGKVFFLAFDQLEGRDELFEKDDDWFEFLAQVSELYNSLPNVLILFTMTLGLRNRLYPRLEKQFKDRIREDRKFMLMGIQPHEATALYRRRIDVWFGGYDPYVRNLLAASANQFLPFEAEEFQELCHRSPTLRRLMDQWDELFREKMLETVDQDDPVFDSLVLRNELRREELQETPFDYTKDHLKNVESILEKYGGQMAASLNLCLTEFHEKPTDGGMPTLLVELRKKSNEDLWVRFFVVPCHTTSIRRWMNRYPSSQTSSETAIFCGSSVRSASIRVSSQNGRVRCTCASSDRKQRPPFGLSFECMAIATSIGPRSGNGRRPSS